MTHILDLENAVRQLGPAIEDYRADFLRVRTRQVTGSWISLTGAGLMVVALMLGGATSSRIVWIALGSSLLLGIALLLAGLWLVAYSWRARLTRFVVFERGFAFQRPHQVECVRWDALSSVRMKSWQWWGTRIFRCQLALKDGNRISFAKNTIDFPGIAHLCDRIQVELTSRQFPPALEAFEQGETLQFGPISVSSLGITKSGKCLPWSEIEKIQLQNGCLVILQSTNSLVWPHATPNTVPNVFVFLTLVQQILPRYRV